MQKLLIESLSAKSTLIYIETKEEDRAVDLIKHISESANRHLIVFDANDTKDAFLGKELESDRLLSNTEGLPSFLQTIMDQEKEKTIENTIFLFKDVSLILNSNYTDPQHSMVPARFSRRLKEIKKILRPLNSSMIFLGEEYDLGNALQNEFKTIYHPPPDENILEEIFYGFITENGLTDNTTGNETVKNEIIKSAKGLTADQLRTCLAIAWVRDNEIGTKTIEIILENKKEIIRKAGILEYIDEDIGMEKVGGLDQLKDWAKKRQRAFTKEAREIELPEPKGILVFGVPGTGKSLISKAISGLWRRPILRFDIGRIFGSFVGESEKNMREALRTAEEIAPCILWIDEIEKAFAGTGGAATGSVGSEVSMRVFGNFLTWMQEKKSEVFIVATANDVTQLPAEFLRKGRFDELFFVDLPNEQEIKQIFKIHLKKYKLDEKLFDLDQLVDTAKKQHNTGSEIEQAIIEAKFNAYDNDREVVIDDILSAIKQVKSTIYDIFDKRMKVEPPQGGLKYDDIKKMAIPASTDD